MSSHGSSITEVGDSHLSEAEGEASDSHLSEGEGEASDSRSSELPQPPMYIICEVNMTIRIDVKQGLLLGWDWQQRILSQQAEHREE